MRKIIEIVSVKTGLSLLLAAALSCSNGFAQTSLKNQNNFGDIAWKESAIPIRPGEPGKAPFWNAHAHQFIYAPSFDYKTVPNAVKYRYTIQSENSSTPFTFENKIPYAPLSPVWTSVPVGYFQLSVIGLSDKGDSVGLAGKGKYYRAAAFNGPYYEPEMDYDKSARLALDNLFKKDYVDYWFRHNEPDPSYMTYRYPAKIYSALVIGAITHAKLKPGTEDAKRSTALAKLVADYMLNIRFKEGTPWEFHVPAYYGKALENSKKEHIQLTNHFTVMGVDAGHAFLDLYDFTGEKKYREAAKRIAQTFIKNQMANGTWYQFVYHATGKPTAENLLIPTAVINYFDRLKGYDKIEGLEAATAKALNWIMNNPVKTFNWQGQFEDISARAPYRNQSREQACDLAIYLFKNKKDLKLAEDLVRFAEDQFVIWEKPLDIAYQNRPGGQSKNWITPSVQEQYVFWMPVGRTAGIMVDTYWEAYVATKEDIYLAKAKSIANAFTKVQKEHAGDYPTFFTKYPMNLWLNSAVYPSKVLMTLQKNLEKIKNSPEQVTFTNPLPVEFGDPYVLQVKGDKYYMYGTGGAKKGFAAYSSTDLVNWKSEGQVYFHNNKNGWSDPKAEWGGAYWAPEVYEVKGKFYMFYSAQWKENPTKEIENFRIGVAVADHPTGPFIDLTNKPVFDPGYPIIDANVFFDDNGKVYLYYSRCCYKHAVQSEVADWAKKKGWFNEIEESWVYGVELKPDFSGVIGEPVLLLRPPVSMSDKQAEWESRSVTSKEVNRRWTEGSVTCKKNGTYYMMYSANYFGGKNYAVGYATAKSPLGPFTKAANNPVLQKNVENGGIVTGTGHNSITYSPDGKEMFCVYHGRTTSTGDKRVVFIDRMKILADGKLVVEGPTTSSQAFPSGISLLREHK